MKEMDRRAWPGLIAGLVGLALGIGGGLLSNLLLGVLAGCAALVACAAALSLLGQLHRAEAAVSSAAAGMSDTGDPPFDDETGLPDDAFFHLLLEGRVAVARRKLNPLGLVLLQLDLDEQARRHSAPAVAALVEVLRHTLRESDVACRLGAGTFALVLEDTPEEGAVEVAERVQDGLAHAGAHAQRLLAGVATYPVHGLAVDDLLQRAEAALTRAGQPGNHGIGRVEVASAD